MEFYSHEEKYLSQHLAGVAQEMIFLLSDISIPHKEEFLQAAALAGLGHDFGKFTTYFQKYLLNHIKEDTKHHHAFISGIWSAYLVQNWIPPEECQGLGKYLPLFVFFAVVRHHGNLDYLDRHLARSRSLQDPGLHDIPPELVRKLAVVEEQVKDLATQTGVNAAIENAFVRCSALRPSLAYRKDLLPKFFGAWREYYGNLFKLHYRFKREKEELKKLAYFTFLALFSALIDADKRDAGEAPEIPRFNITEEAVKIYREMSFGDSMQKKAPQEKNNQAVLELREKVYQNVCTRAKLVSLDKHLLTITAPTGSGKTLASIAASLVLRQRIKEERGYLPRIIYSLPFTNIIDQTHEVFQQVFATSLPDFHANESAYLLKHHYLADVAYQLNQHDSDEISIDKALLLIESWQSEVIVTTFVQLLSTLIGHRNKMLKKFNRMIGSIIILDEVQNIPVEYWSLVRETFIGAAKYLGAYVILMTATRPLLFHPGEVVELAGEDKEVKQFFSSVNRVQLDIEIEPRSIQDVCLEFTSKYNPDRSYLFVANTIKSSLEIYQNLKHLILSEGNTSEFYYLSTNIVPLERKHRIAEISRAIKEKRNPVVVSTQVVEAGVDLDFHEVWRDLGPVDAVIQVAGRCNRNFKMDRGFVKVVHLVNEKGYSFAKRIYGTIHYQQARKLFEGWTSLGEPDFYNLIEQFFHAVEDAKSKEEAREILDAMKELVFWKTGEADKEESTVSSFALIKSLPNYVEVFVETDEASREIWNSYCRKVWSENDLSKRRFNFLSLKKDFYERIISVPNKLVLGFYDASKKIYPVYLPGELLEYYYDYETGFKVIRDAGDEVMIF